MFRFKYIILVIFIGLFLILGIFEFSSGKQERKELFIVKRGQNVLQISTFLKNEGYIKSKLFFVLDTFKDGRYSKLKAGKYKLEGSLSDKEIIEKLIKGQSIPVAISIIPGQTIKNIAQNLELKGVMSRKEFLNLTAPSKEGDDYSKRLEIEKDFSFLSDKPKDIGLEGYLYPDTYQMEPGIEKKEVIRQFLLNFQDKLSPNLIAEIKKQNRSIFEAINMASILEKEIKTIEDKKIVSGILWKRIGRGLPLEVDSTILYFLLSDYPSTDDKNIDSLYNTYRYGGLPASPICNPGMDSILAAVYPENSDYWYYLSATDGKTIFSKNYGEHLINKAKYID